MPDADLLRGPWHDLPAIRDEMTVWCRRHGGRLPTIFQWTPEDERTCPQPAPGSYRYVQEAHTYYAGDHATDRVLRMARQLIAL